MENSHRSCRGPTYEKKKKSVCLEAMLAKMQKMFLGGFGTKNHNFACVSVKRLVSNSVEKRKHYLVILTKVGCFVKCASL